MLLFSSIGTLIVVAFPDVMGFAMLLIIPGLILSFCVPVFYLACLYAITRYWILPRLSWTRDLSGRWSSIAAWSAIAIVIVTVPIVAQAEARLRMQGMLLEEVTPSEPLRLTGHIRVEGLHGGTECKYDCRRLLRMPGVRSVTLTRYRNISFDRIRADDTPDEFSFTNTFVLRNTPSCRIMGAEAPQYGDDPCVTKGFDQTRFDHVIRSGQYTLHPFAPQGMRHNSTMSFLLVQSGGETVARTSSAQTRTMEVPLLLAPQCGGPWTPTICFARERLDSAPIKTLSELVAL